MDMNDFDRLSKEIEDLQNRYKRYLSERERKRKREQDSLFTKKDRAVLVQSFVIGGIIENVLTKTITKIL
ncbi:MAG: hypothetical protein ABWJ98_06165 [Hydrogenothermaceae bacterium]